MARPRVLILGGGFVAIGAVRKLRRAWKTDMDVTVIDRENYHFYHGLVSEFVTGRINASNVLAPSRRIFAPARFHFGEVESIELDRQTVRVNRNVDGTEQELPYDHLIIGLGSADNLEMYPGLGEHAFKLKTFDDCFRLKNHILSMFELAEIESDPAEKRRLLSFFIAGGGYAGTEMAAELADFFSLICGKEFPNVRKEECRVVLVQPGPTILPELYGKGTGGMGHAEGHPKLVDYAIRHVQKLGVELMTDTFVTAVSPNEVTLSNDDHVPANTIISAVGTKPVPIVADLDVPKDERGRIKTDTFCRVEGFDNVWAGGDCAAVPDPDGGYSVPRALYALQHGVRAARNIVLSSEGKPPKPYTYRAFGQGVPLGRRRAVAILKGMEIKGVPTWLTWKVMLIRFTPTWDRKLRIMSDWLVAPLVGRDIVESSITDADDYEVHQRLYQPGEVIVSEGRVGRYVHVIVEGKVELVRTVDGKQEVIETLGPGKHFGQVWRDQTAPEAARARTQVRTFTLRADQTRRIQRLIASLKEVVLEDTPLTKTSG